MKLSSTEILLNRFLAKINCRTVFLIPCIFAQLIFQLFYCVCFLLAVMIRRSWISFLSWRKHLCFGNAVFAVGVWGKRSGLHNVAKVSEIESSLRPYSALILILLKTEKGYKQINARAYFFKNFATYFSRNRPAIFSVRTFSGRSVKNSFKKTFMLL